MRKKIPITSKFTPRHFVFLKNKTHLAFLPNTISFHPSWQTRFEMKHEIMNNISLLSNSNNIAFTRSFIKKKKKKYTLRLYAKEYGYLSFAELEAARRAIKRTSKRALRNRIFLLSYPYFYLTKKPAEVRMGKGKGTKLRDKVCPVRPGKIIFELKLVNFRKGIYALSLAQKKLSLFTGITKKLLLHSMPRRSRLLRQYTIY